MPGPTEGRPRVRRRRRADEPAPVAWLARKTLTQHSHLTPSPAPRRRKVTWAELRAILIRLAVVAVAAVVVVWLWRHSWLLVEVGRGVRAYFDGWAIDVENEFGLVVRIKIVLAVGLPVLALGLVLGMLWTMGDAVVTMLRRRWRRLRVHWRRPF